MLPQFGLGTSLAYTALNESNEFAEKVKLAKKARRSQEQKNRPHPLSGWLVIFRPGRLKSKISPSR